MVEKERVGKEVVAETAGFGAMIAKLKEAGVGVLLVSKLLEKSCMMLFVKPRPPWNRSEKRGELWLLRLAPVPRPKPGAAAEGCTVSWKPCFLSLEMDN